MAFHYYNLHHNLDQPKNPIITNCTINYNSKRHSIITLCAMITTTNSIQLSQMFPLTIQFTVELVLNGC